MNISIDNLIKNSFVITINDKRYDDFCKRFDSHGFNSKNIRKFRGCQLKNGFYETEKFIKTGNILNCSISHLNIVQIAKYLDLDYCCIFEDDCLPCIDCYNKLQQKLIDLPDTLDLLKLGYIYISENYDNTSDDLIKPKLTYGSHAYIIFKKYYDSYIKIWDTDFVADLKLLNNKNFNIYTFKYPLFIQDITYTEALHSSHSHARELKSINQKYLLENFEL